MEHSRKQAMGGGWRIAAAALATLLASACATQKVWVNHEVPEDQWASDRMLCREQARVQAERDFSRDQMSSRTMNRDVGASWSSQMNQFSAQQNEGRLFASCMTARGYSLQSPDQTAADAEAAPPAEGAAAPK